MQRTFRYLALSSILGLLAGHAAPAAACPYDLLAMCKVGKNQWKNCCEVWKAKQPSGGSSSTSNGAASAMVASGRAPNGHAAQGGLTTPPASGFLPTLAQLGSSQAVVPMTHGSCGLDCGTHVLKNPNGNLDMRFKIGMTCPKDTTVIHLLAKPQGVNATTVVSASTGSLSYTKEIVLKPFTADQIEQACKLALGGDWPSGNLHQGKTVKKTLKTTIEVFGQCSGWTNEAARTYPALLTLTCQDKEHTVPVG